MGNDALNQYILYIHCIHQLLTNILYIFVIITRVVMMTYTFDDTALAPNSEDTQILLPIYEVSLYTSGCW